MFARAADGRGSEAGPVGLPRSGGTGRMSVRGRRAASAADRADRIAESDGAGANSPGCWRPDRAIPPSAAGAVVGQATRACGLDT